MEIAEYILDNFWKPVKLTLKAPSPKMLSITFIQDLGSGKYKSQLLSQKE